MRLWTIQTAEAFKAFESRGVLRGDLRRVFRFHRPAYEWMARQMIRRIGPPPRGCRTPVWAWMIWNERTARPDLRGTGHLPPGTAGVRIEFEAHPAQVLLSDFTRWHAVVNNHFLADNEADDASLWPAGRKATYKSWERIFDLGRGCPEYFGPVEARGVQAALWQIEWSQVRQVTHFTAR